MLRCIFQITFLFWLLFSISFVTSSSYAGNEERISREFDQQDDQAGEEQDQDSFPLPPLRSFKYVQDNERQSKSIRRSGDDYGYSSDGEDSSDIEDSTDTRDVDSGEDDDLSAKILRSFHGDKSSKVVHMTRSIAEQQPSVFVYLPSPIRNNDAGKRSIVTTIPNDQEDNEDSYSSSAKKVQYDDEEDTRSIDDNRDSDSGYDYGGQDRIITKTIPVQKTHTIFTRLQPVYVKKKTYVPTTTITRKIVPIPVTTTKLVRNVVIRPVIKSKIVYEKQIAPTPKVVLVRTRMPLTKTKTVLITPPVPHKTTTVLTTHYTPGSRTVVYEAEHPSVRSTFVSQPTYSYSVPSKSYSSEWVPMMSKANAIKAALKSKFLNSPALSYIRRQDDDRSLVGTRQGQSMSMYGAASNNNKNYQPQQQQRQQQPQQPQQQQPKHQPKS